MKVLGCIPVIAARPFLIVTGSLNGTMVQVRNGGASSPRRVSGEPRPSVPTDAVKWIKESRHGKGQCLVVN